MRMPSATVRSWTVAVVAGFVAYLAAAQGLFVLGGSWQIPLFVGCGVGLVCSLPWQAAVVAVACELFGSVALPPFVSGGQALGVVGWALALVLAPAAAFAVASLVTRVGGARAGVVRVAVSAVLVVWVVVNLWMPLTLGGWPPQSYGLLSAESVRAVPQPHHYGDDEAIYRRVFVLMHQGEAYYPAFRDAWLGDSANAAMPASAVGIRLPTFFWLWRLLPSDPFSAVYLFLAFASAGVVASAFIAGELAGARLAPLAAVAFASYALGVGISSYALFLDLPAMVVALVGVALFVRARTGGGARWLWGAAACLALAALTREILVYLLVFAALSALLQPRGQRLRAAVPWIAGLAVFAIGYAAHAMASAPYLSAGSASVSYLNGGMEYLTDAFRRFTGALAGGRWTLTALVSLGFVGAVAARRRAGAAFSAFAAVSIVVPLASMLVVGNSGRDAAGVANYWGLLVIPLALSLWPVAVLALEPADEPATRPARDSRESRTPGRTRR